MKIESNSYIYLENSKIMFMVFKVILIVYIEAIEFAWSRDKVGWALAHAD